MPVLPQHQSSEEAGGESLFAVFHTMMMGHYLAMLTGL